MKRLTFGHVINHREPKGSKYVLDAVHQARMRGADFGFIFGERLPFIVAEDLYKKIDILLEQFIIGWYGLQACEFALMKKPVVVYIRKEDGPPLVPTDMWNEIPFINCKPEDLTQTIINLTRLDSEELSILGQQGYDFVRKWHNDMFIANEVRKGLFGEA